MVRAVMSLAPGKKPLQLVSESEIAIAVKTARGERGEYRDTNTKIMVPPAKGCAPFAKRRKSPRLGSSLGKRG